MGPSGVNQLGFPMPSSRFSPGRPLLDATSQSRSLRRTTKDLPLPGTAGGVGRSVGVSHTHMRTGVASYGEDWR